MHRDVSTSRLVHWKLSTRVNGGRGCPARIALSMIKVILINKRGQVGIAIHVSHTCNRNVELKFPYVGIETWRWTLWILSCWSGVVAMIWKTVSTNHHSCRVGTICYVLVAEISLPWTGLSDNSIGTHTAITGSIVACHKFVISLCRVGKSGGCLEHSCLFESCREIAHEPNEFSWGVAEWCDRGLSQVHQAQKCEDSVWILSLVDWLSTNSCLLHLNQILSFI
jgi:hypothetical protein